MTWEEGQPQREEERAAGHRWRVELLGRLRAVSPHGAVDRFPTQKVGALLAWLAYDLHRPHPREELIEQLWPEVDREAGQHSLRQALVWLRRSLAPLGIPTDALLLVDRQTMRLNPAGVSTDVAEFDAALRAAEPGAQSEPVASLVAAVDRYGGELLPGYYEDWVLQERQWLAVRYFQALDRLLAALESAGDFPRALDYARRGVAADPLREEAQRELIRLYAAAGQPSTALRQYQELKRLLKAQLGTSPQAATRALVREIRRQTALRPRPPILRPDPGTPLVGQPSALGSGEQRVVTLLRVAISRAPEPTRSLEPALVEVIVKYEGAIETFDGEGLVAVFGAAPAHEDDPERALRAALEIWEAAQRLGLRMTAGVSTGEATLSSSATRERRATGPAVGLAAWLQEHAEPGQILVSEATWQLTHGAFRFRPLPLPQPTPEAAEATQAYTLEGIAAQPQKARGVAGQSAALVGRTAELTHLQQALDALRQGQGQMVSLIGEAGVGKSRLVAQLKQQSGVRCSVFGVRPEEGEDPTPNTEHRTPPLLWLEGRCREMSIATGYSLFLDLFRDYFAVTAASSPRSHGQAPGGESVSLASGGDAQARGEHLSAALRHLAAQGALPPERLPEILPFLGRLLAARGDNGEPLSPSASPEERRHQTFLAVQEFFLALARLQPLVLVLEDLHWADRLSLDLLSLLMEALPQAPLLLLCVYRPEPEHRSWHLGSIASRKCPERYTELHLGELSPAESRELLTRLLPGAGTAKGQGPQGPGPGPGLPPGVRSVIQSRVDRLAPEQKELLQRAAVIGSHFRRSLLERVLGGRTGDAGPAPVSPPAPNSRRLTPNAPAELDAALWELEERGLIYQERATPEEEYAFRHALTQETIYHGIVEAPRALFHQRVAEALEALYQERLEEYSEQLAYHYERSGADEKAVEYLLKAGEKSRQAYLNEEAIRYFQRALERLGSAQSKIQNPKSKMDRRLEALTGLGRSQTAMGNCAEGEAYITEAIALGRELGLAPGELVRLYCALAETLFWQSRYDEVLSVGEQGLALLGESAESVEAGLMNQVIAAAHFGRRDWPKWREFTYRNARLIERLPDCEELSSLYGELVEVCVFDKNPEEAVRWLEALRRKAEPQHDLDALGYLHLEWGVHVLVRQGDLHGAISHFQRALEIFTKIGGKHVSSCLESIGQAYLALGEIQKAEEYTGRALKIAEARGFKRQVVGSLVCMGTIFLCQGANEKAMEAFQAAVPLWREFGKRAPELICALGRALLTRGRREEALRAYHDALALPELWPTAASYSRSVALSLLEEAHEDAEGFRAFCRRFREEHPEVSGSPPSQWFLEPTQPDFGFRIFDFGLPPSSDQIQNPKSKMDGGSGTTRSRIAPSPSRMAWRSMRPTVATSGT